MRRISLALALIGAVTAAGCGKTSTSNTGGNRGVTENTFKVTVQNGQNGNSSLAITGGYVTSTPLGIDCGVAPHNSCEFDFAAGASVTLTAHALAGYNFWSFAGDCYTAGDTCTINSSLNTYSDQYVLARFGAIGEIPPGGHPNWNPHGGGVSHAAEAEEFMATVPGQAFVPSSAAWQCSACHGSLVLGMGLAPNCANCHIGSAYKTWGNTPANPPAVLANGEVCTGCHIQSGANHQALYNKWNGGMPNAATNALRGGTLTATVDSVASSAVGTKYDIKVTFSLKQSGAALSGVDFNAWGTKTLYLAKYDRANGTIPVNLNVGFGSIKETTPGTYVATKANQSTNWAAADGFAYLYVVKKEPVFYPEGHYSLNTDMADAGLKFDAGTPASGITTGVAATWNYASVAQSSGCERCHGAPYAKHGYRRAKAFGLADDFLACKACHYDTRPGTDFDWQVLRNEPAVFASLYPISDATWTSGTGLAMATKYAYTATVLNDTHMSHGMEFEFPQSMANCTVCHGTAMSASAGGVFEDKNFNGFTCKSCHATDANAVDTGINGEPRAPALNATSMPGLSHHTFDWKAGTVGGRQCFECHADNAHPGLGETQVDNDGKGPTMFGFYVPLLREIHNGGYEPLIYVNTLPAGTAGAVNGTRYDNAFTTDVQNASMTGSSLTFDAVITSAIDITAHTNANGNKFYPTFYVAPFGYNTKDFLSSINCNLAPAVPPYLGSRAFTTCVSGTNGWSWTTAAEGARGIRYTVTVDLNNAKTGKAWYGQIASGVIKRLGIGFRPTLDDGAGELLAIRAPLKEFTITGNVLASGDSSIAVTAKCEKCHDALATTFHVETAEGQRGGSVAFCRVCHVPGSGAGHLEMQSRSIDSYVHAIHENQKIDIQNVNFNDLVAATGYELYIGGVFPNFAGPANCEACHESTLVNGKKAYEAPDEATSLPAILSASAANSATTGLYRSVSVPSVITGPAAKACGGCHRAYLIKNQMFNELGAFDDHTKAFGFRETPANATLMGTLIRNIYGTY